MEERSYADIARRLARLERRLEKTSIADRPYTQVYARVYYAAGAQSIANDTLQAITFDTVRVNTQTAWVIGNPTRLTCAVAGFYAIGGGVRFAANTTGYRQLTIRLNGATQIATANMSAVSAVGITTAMTIATGYLLAVGDYVELAVRQNSGGALNVDSQSAITPEFWWAQIA